MSGKILVPLFIECVRCGAMKRVKDRTVQKIQRFCSKRCGCLARQHTNFTREANSRGGKMRASRMRAALLERVGHLSPLEAFRTGYKVGLQSKHRQLKARVGRQKGAAA